MIERTLESLQEDLKSVRSQITGRDINDACIVFGKDPLTPLTTRAVEKYLNGEGPDLELGEKLLDFFQERAREYQQLEERRLASMKARRKAS